MAEVYLLSKTENLLDVIYTATRTCYNAGLPSDMWNDRENIDEEKKLKLLKHVVNSGHGSVLEHGNFTFSIEGLSRASSHQLVRHRHASYCISGDTKISTSSQKTNKKTIKELYELKPQYKKNIKLKCMDEETKGFLYKPLKNILYTGVQPVYEIITDGDYCIRTTLNHKFLSKNKWCTLSELSVGDLIYTNGCLAYKDKEWLKEHYIDNKESQEYMGMLCGVSKHTIRKYIRLYGLQKPLGSWSKGVSPVNKGRTKYDYEPMKRTSEKMVGNKNAPRLFGCDNPAYRGDNITNRGGYHRTHQKYKRLGKCKICGYTGYTELHHIDKNPKNISPENIIELCFNCHRQQHKQRFVVAKLRKINTIRYVGEQDTYDIEMMDTPHNFVANGFIVHNSQQSQRYCEFKEDEQYLRQLQLAIRDSKQEAYKELEEILNKYFVGVNKDTVLPYSDSLIAYMSAINKGWKAEDARQFLPNAFKTNIVCTMNIRELMWVCGERMCNLAQKEVQTIVRQMAKLVIEEYPFLKEYLQPKCERLGYCPENKKRSCGRKPTKSEIFKEV